MTTTSYFSFRWIITKSNISGAKWSRNCSHMQSNWVRTEFLLGLLLLILQFSAGNSLIFSVRFYLLLDVFLFIFIWSLKCLLCTSIFGFPIPFGIFKIFLMLHFYIIHWNILEFRNTPGSWVIVYFYYLVYELFTWNLQDHWERWR